MQQEFPKVSLDVMNNRSASADLDENCVKTPHGTRKSVTICDLRRIGRGGYDSAPVKTKPDKSQHQGVKIVAQNRQAPLYNYHLLDSLEAGLVLVGTEVKTLREGKGTLREAYAEIRPARLGW